MKFKRVSAIVLALAMTASTAAFAAGETPDVEVNDEIIREVNHDQGDISLLSGFGGMGPVSIPIALPKQNYTTTITINGEPLEFFEYEKSVPGSWESEIITVNLTDLPSVPAGYVPMRAIAQADDGSVYWDKDGNRSWFDMGSYRIITNFNDMSVKIGLDGEQLEGVEVILLGGTTFLPVSVINGLEGFEVVDNGAGGYEIKTPNGAPIVKLGKRLLETAGIGTSQKFTAEGLEEFWGENYGFSADYVTEGFFALGSMVTPDTLLVGKVAEGQAEAMKAAWDNYVDSLPNTWSWYLGGSQMPKVEDARFVTEGDWFLAYVGNNADEVVAQFKTAVAEQ